MAARILPAVTVTPQTVEIFVPADPLVDRVIEFLDKQDAGLLCDNCAALMRLRTALLASKVGDRG